MSKHWNEYVKVAYDLILEGEGISKVYLQDEVEAYVVHLFAKYFDRVNIGDEPIAIKMMTAIGKGENRDRYQSIADECLLIHSYPIRKNRWPTETYYVEMGIMAYGMARIEIMEHHFAPASKVLRTVFNRIG